VTFTRGELFGSGNVRLYINIPNPMIYLIFKHAHSLTRWLLLASLIATIAIALYSIIRKKDMNSSGRQLSRFTCSLSQFQLTFGILLYVISPKVVFSGESMSSPILRFFLVEHALGMLIATALIMIGYIRAKKAGPTLRSTRQVFWYYLVSLILILAMIPWPSRPFGGQWF